jgi:signal transduction histidine kinase
LLTLTDTALAHFELDDLLPELLRRVRDVMAMENAVILLLADDGQQLVVRAAHGLEEAVAAGKNIPLGQGFAGRIAASRAPLIVEDLSTFPVVSPYLREKLHAAVGVPLLLRERVLGVLYIGTADPHHFTERDVQLLQRAAERMALAIERAQLFQAEQEARREREEARASELAAREVAQQLDQFFAMAAHDIRSPITVLNANVDLAYRRAQRLVAALEAPDGQAAGLAAQVVSALDNAKVSNQRFLRLVAVLFDVARARTGTLSLTVAPCDLGALVREQVTAQQAAVPSRMIQLYLPDWPVQVIGDADRLGQVLTNYLANAVKYSSDDQPVVVRLEVTDGLAVVYVQDHGPGLAAEEQRRVWELYHHAPGVAVQSGTGVISGSLGLGLHICKRLMELHPGGQVGVESVVGKGSTFWFRLPVAADPGSDAHSSTQST